jgi:phage-related protein
MNRKFRPFDEITIISELRKLPAQDRSALFEAMQHFQNGTRIGYTHKRYGKELEMITDSGVGQGRCLFFVRDQNNLIILLVYKKESQKLPKQIEQAARIRLAKYRNERND